jgi:hypothetical protein
VGVRRDDEGVELLSDDGGLGGSISHVLDRGDSPDDKIVRHISFCDVRSEPVRDGGMEIDVEYTESSRSSSGVRMVSEENVGDSGEVVVELSGVS